MHKSHHLYIRYRKSMLFLRKKILHHHHQVSIQYTIRLFQFINLRTVSSSSISLKENKKIVFNNYHGRPAISSPTTKKFVCKILSNDHDNSQELPKRYICLICGKRFVRPGSLTTHTYSHTGEVSILFYINIYVSLIYYFRNHFNAQ